MKIKQQELANLLLSEGKVVHKTVYGDSMLPTIPNGTLVSIEPADSSRIHYGDVVYILMGNGQALIHRIFRFPQVQGRGWVQTWGDNNEIPDPPQPLESLKGRIVSIKRDGKWRKLRGGLAVWTLHSVKNPFHLRYILTRLIQKWREM